MSHPFFDTTKYPSDRPDAIALLNSLAAAIRNPNQIQLMYEQCGGTELSALYLSQTHPEIWADVLKNLTAHGLLGRLLDCVKSKFPNSPEMQKVIRDVYDAQPLRKNVCEDLRPIFLHDYNLPQTFVARDSELLRLSRLLTPSHGQPPQARVATVTAIGGVGKSCLCRALIDRPEISANFSRVIWFSFYEARAEAEDYFLRDVLTHGFGWTDREKPLEGTKEAVRLRRALAEELGRDRTLLVLDGLEVIQFTQDPESPNYGAIKPIWGEIEKLLRYVLNGPRSICLITSRVPLRTLETIRGYHNVSLDLFTSDEGALLLSSLGVLGDPSHLKACAESLGGHALSLVAAGRFMSRRRIAADRLVDLVDDPEVFSRTSEGEKVKRICEWYRAELSPEQEYFLTRLSLHGRSVTAVNYPVLILGYDESERDPEVEEEIIQPLVERGLVDRFESSDSGVTYTAHPLMKLAFSTWLEPDDRKRAHEEWARAAAAEPGLFFTASSAMSLEQLQPLVDATEQYLAADNLEEAWRIFNVNGRNLGLRLGQLGYFQLSLRLAHQFEVRSSWTAFWTPIDSVHLCDLQAWLSNRLERTEDALNFRRKQLAVAREGHFPRLPEVEALVADALASEGYVRNAVEIHTSELAARGKIALAQGHFVRAAKLFVRALENKWGHSRSSVRQQLAEALYRSGKFDEASIMLNEALEVANQNGFTCCQKAIMSQLTEIALRCNDLPLAERWAEARAELLRRLAMPSDEDSWLLLARGDADAALAAVRKTGTTPNSLIRRHVELARIYLKLDRRREAKAELDAAKREQLLSGYKRLKNDIISLRKELLRR